MNKAALCLALLTLCSQVLVASASAPDENTIWLEFSESLRNGTITLDRIRPYEELGDSFKPVILGFLETLHTAADKQDWSREPEIIRSANRVQYVFPWTSGGEEVSFCFSIVVDGREWFFQHLEALYIRLDKIDSTPVTEFPDISEEQKSWIRSEIYWSFLVLNIYLPISAEKGRDIALNMLKDGGGYYVAAKAWVPFTPPHRSFILYLCWEQARLRGNEVTLEQLTDSRAVISLKTHYFDLYHAAAHLRPKISIEDYTAIFETIWLDRALKAGWNLDIEYAEDHTVTFIFTR